MRAVSFGGWCHLATADHHHLEGDADGDVVVDTGEDYDGVESK
jgi:hypothetical protein